MQPKKEENQKMKKEMKKQTKTTVPNKKININCRGTGHRAQNVGVAWYATQKGITLVSLIITIIVLIILAGVTLNVTLGENGILNKSKQAVDKYQDAAEQEQDQLQEIYGEIQELENQEYNYEKGVNKPKLTEGMIPVKYNGTNWVICSENDPSWYNYTDQNNNGTIEAEEKQWANVMLCDGTYDTSTEVGTEVAEANLGSMFVWIPRYAYKITGGYHSNTGGYHSNTGGAIDVKFLVGTTNRTENNEETIKYNEKTTEGYTKFPDGYVTHPAFTSKVEVGGWDKEITGIWMAKFEAGYPMEGTIDSTSTTPIGSTNFYYPVFKGKRYSYNYITIGNCYTVSQNMTNDGNPYGITTSANSHLIKNSEWGAVAYLTISQYGKTTEIYPNNISFEGNRKNINKSSVYALTGFCADNENRGINNVSSITEETMAGSNIGDTLTGINGSTDVTSYAWNTTDGYNASTTGNIYGIYDMSGGCWEYPATTIPTGHSSLNSYGSSFANATQSNKYVTVYPIGSSTQAETDISKSYEAFGQMYGDAVWETSSQIGSNYSWNGDRSDEQASTYEPFFLRGGGWGHGSLAGSFAFAERSGYSNSMDTYRACLVVD